MKNKNILVTGGAGFIGSNLVKQLIDDGNKVRVLDNFSSGYASNLDSLKPIKINHVDVINKDLVEFLMKDVDIVFHLAASVGNKRSIDNPIIDAETNVIGTLNILEAARKAGVKKIITSSSAGIYGELKTIPINENHPVEPDTPYGCTKLCEEKLCLSYAKMYDIEIICLRYFNVYGENQRFDAYGNVIPIFVYRMFNGQPLLIYGDGEQTRDFVNVKDVVQANIKAAETQGISGAFNIGSGKNVTINKLVNLMISNYSGSVVVEHTDKRMGDVKDSLADISMAKEKLSYNPNVDLETGLSEYIEWVKDNIKTFL
jgi:nucleoside-diphosphate-sugar epimerase